MCYYGSWAVYRPGAGKYDVENIDPNICTHIVFGFAGLHKSNYQIYSLDPWNELDDNYGKGKFNCLTITTGSSSLQYMARSRLLPCFSASSALHYEG